MSTPGHLRRFGRVSALSSLLVVIGCPKKEQEPEPSAEVAKADPQAEPVEPADDPDPGEDGTEAIPAEAEGGTAEPAAAEAADAVEEGTGSEADEQGAADETGEEPAGPDPKALLRTAINRRTSDDQAKTLFGEAEEAGATVRDVAKAAVDRGLQLHATPDRAQTFFEWAAEKDPKFPDPVWQLARQAAIEGDVDRAKELLGDVKKRGGKKLLQQIDFDPMWEILKDDPDVRKLL